MEEGPVVRLTHNQRSVRRRGRRNHFAAPTEGTPDVREAAFETTGRELALSVNRTQQGWRALTVAAVMSHPESSKRR